MSPKVPLGVFLLCMTSLAAASHRRDTTPSMSRDGSSETPAGSRVQIMGTPRVYIERRVRHRDESGQVRTQLQRVLDSDTDPRSSTAREHPPQGHSGHPQQEVTPDVDDDVVQRSGQQAMGDGHRRRGSGSRTPSISDNQRIIRIR